MIVSSICFHQLIDIASFISGDRSDLKDLEDRIVDGELQPDDIAGLELVKQEESINSTTPKRPAAQKRSIDFSQEPFTHKLWR